MSSNQHYVPRFLLKNFSKNKIVYRYDKKTGRVEQKNIKSVCSQDDFYNLSLEKICENQPKTKEELQASIGEIPKDVILSCDKAITEVETRTGEIVKKVLSHKSLAVLTDKEKFMLCLFTSLQMLRTSHQRNDIKTITKTMANKIKEFYDAGAMKSGSYEKWQEDNIGKDFDIFAKLMNITKLGEFAIEDAKILFLTKNMFLIDVLEDDLYISDCPVVLDNKNDYKPYGNIGLLVPGIEIYLPLSPRVILAYHCKTLLPPYNILTNQSKLFYDRYKAMENGGCIYQKDEGHFFNYLQLSFSDRYLVAKHDCFAYAKNIIKEHPEFKNCIAKLKVM